MEEQEKLQRLAKIAADKKFLNECLRDKRCAVIEDKRNKTKHKKQQLESWLEQDDCDY